MSWRDDRRSAYAEKLLDPRWQKLRLRVLERDGFTCRWCKAEDKTLNVHHLYYESGNEPWDYPLTAFLTLCRDCHQTESEGRRAAEEKLLHAIRKAGLSNHHRGMLVHLVETATQIDLGERQPYYLLWAALILCDAQSLRELYDYGRADDERIERAIAALDDEEGGGHP